jgi:predicted transposase/invertase (TIGR01784 family)
MSQIINPHAMFFEKVFSRKDVAVDLVQNYLPKEIINDLDLSTLQLENKSFISNELKPSQSDLLFKVLTKDCNAVFIYFLLEHKSFVDRWVMLQLLAYIVQICDEQRAINKQKRQEIKAENIKNEKPENEGIDTEYLYPIIPVVFYHGKVEWDPKKDFSELFHKGHIYKKYLPDYTFELINTANYADDQFKGNVILRVSLMAMKHFFMDDFETKVPELLCLLANLIEQIDSEIGFLEALLRYLSANKKHDKKWLQTNLKIAFKDKGGDIMTSIADIWIDEGKKEGERLAAKKLIAKQMAKKFNINLKRVMPRLNPLRTDDIMELGEYILVMKTFDDANQWINARKKKIKMMT